MGTQWVTLRLESSKKTELLDITDEVTRACGSAGAKDGLAVIYCPHTTAGVIIQEAEPGLLHDLERWLTQIVPSEGAYQHDRVDDNAASHLRAVVAGTSAMVPLQRGALGLGTWQRILFVELDGPRTRQVHVGVID